MAKNQWVARCQKARNFLTNTCPASRHAQMIAEALIAGVPYPMLTEEPLHCGESIIVTVAALYEARTRIADLEAVVAAIAAAARTTAAEKTIAAVMPEGP